MPRLAARGFKAGCADGGGTSSCKVAGGRRRITRTAGRAARTRKLPLGGAQRARRCGSDGRSCGAHASAPALVIPPKRCRGFRCRIRKPVGRRRNAPGLRHALGAQGCPPERLGVGEHPFGGGETPGGFAGAPERTRTRHRITDARHLLALLRPERGSALERAAMGRPQTARAASRSIASWATAWRGARTRRGALSRMPGTPREHPGVRGEGRTWSAAERGGGKSDQPVG